MEPSVREPGLPAVSDLAPLLETGKAAVLLITDDLTRCERVALRLLQAGYPVALAATAEEGIARVCHAVPGLLLIDADSRGLSAQGLLAVLARIPESRGVPVVLYGRSVEVPAAAAEAGPPITRMAVRGNLALGELAERVVDLIEAGLRERMGPNPLL